MSETIDAIARTAEFIRKMPNDDLVRMYLKMIIDQQHAQGIINELVAALKSWTDHFTRLHDSLEDDDPIKPITRQFHAQRIEASLAAIAKAEKGTT